MYYRPHYLYLRNFMSFGNAITKINLNFEEPTLIVGRNHDSAVDGQLDSNGAGKTTIANGLNYVKYDTIVSGKTVNADDLINNTNKKDMYVAEVFEVEDNTFYKVERYRRNKAMGGTGVRIMKRVGGTADDDFDPATDDITPDSIANSNKKIVEIMGMPFEVFSRIVAFSASHKPFLFLSAGEQTEIMEEICGVTELSAKAEILKARVKEDKRELDRLNEINATIKAQRNQIVAQIDSAKAKVTHWDREQQAKLKLLREQVAAHLALNIDYKEQEEYFEAVAKGTDAIVVIEGDIRDLSGDLRRLQADADRAGSWEREQEQKIAAAEATVTRLDQGIDYDVVIDNLKKVAVIAEKIADCIQAKLEAERNRNRCELALEEKKKELAHLSGSTCPYCSQQFLDAKAKVAEVESEISTLWDQVSAAKDEIEYRKDMLDACDVEANSISTLDFINEAQVVKAQTALANAKNALLVLQNEGNPYQNTADTSKEIASLTDDIAVLRTSHDKRMKKLDIIKAELRFPNFLTMMTEKSNIERAKAEIARLEGETNPLLSTVVELESMKLEATKDKEIEELDDHIEHQQFLVKLLTKKDSFIRKVLLQNSLPFLNTRLRGYLEKIGFNHKVMFQEDLTVKISQFGNGIGFGNLSSGQKARINLALSFAFRDVLQSRHGKLKFCILDECLDVGLGNVGVQLAAKMIKRVAVEDKLSMFVISHRDEIASMFDRRLVVELNHGFSTVSNEDE